MSTRGFFRTKVAGRILGLFFMGAIIPVVVLQLLSFRAVSDLLEGQSEDRLSQLADATVQITLERLSSSASWVESAGGLAIAMSERGGVVRGQPDGGRSALQSLAPALSGVALSGPVGTEVVVGSIGDLPRLSADEMDRVRSGQPVLRSDAGTSTEKSSLLLVMPALTNDERLLWAELNPDSVWASVMLLGAGPEVSDLCVLDASLLPFACKGGAGSTLPARVRAVGLAGVQGLTRFEDGGEGHLAAWRRVYLRSAFGAPDWTVVVSESESSVYAPVSSFLYNLPLALGVGVGLVLLLANLLVRRTMEPLRSLSAGTERIARHDLTARVEVLGDDEFGDLANSFNSMAARLAAQFGEIESAQAIDRAVIEDNNSTRAVEALIEGVESLVPFARCAVVLVEEVAEDPGALYRRSGEAGLLRTGFSVAQMATVELAARTPSIELESDEIPRVLLEAGWGLEGRRLLLIPMKVQESIVGFSVIELRVSQSDSEPLERALKLVKRASVALNENRLRRELIEFSGETLRALANAIDAKSKWTTGHSERVTDLAWSIGRSLGLGVAQLDALHRGGLLHDIGKIGVSTQILDWPGRLDAEQRTAVEAHTTIGATILAPIRVFRPLLPIVLHHHERWDGGGYPHGLAGTDIPYLARVLAVADVFDALASPRPYRDALPMAVVIEHIQEETGAAFDPDIVAAFERVMNAGWVHEVREQEVVFDG